MVLTLHSSYEQLPGQHSTPDLLCLDAMYCSRRHPGQQFGCNPVHIWTTGITKTPMLLQYTLKMR